MNLSAYIQSWRETLSKNLPGEKAHLLMAPEFRGSYAFNSDPVRAAVLALMYPTLTDVSVVFMKRNEYDGPHSAQVSFPGGAWEEKDRSLETTAIRETREELGITGNITLLGSLTSLYIPVSNFLVQPYVGWCDSKPEFDPDPSEVQYVIESCLKDLLEPNNKGSELMFRHGQSIAAPYYAVGKEKIWGATAMILSEFLQLASRLQ